jgi:hypothetical protein
MDSKFIGWTRNRAKLNKRLNIDSHDYYDYFRYDFKQMKGA